MLRALLGGRAGLATSEPARRLVEALGEPSLRRSPGLGRLAPDAARVADAGVRRSSRLGLARRPAEMLWRIARALAERKVWLEPGSDVAAAHRALLAIDGVGERLATRIVAHALHWPDAFDPRIAGSSMRPARVTRTSSGVAPSAGARGAATRRCTSCSACPRPRARQSI